MVATINRRPFAPFGWPSHRRRNKRNKRNSYSYSYSSNSNSNGNGNDEKGAAAKCMVANWLIELGKKTITCDNIDWMIIVTPKMIKMMMMMKMIMMDKREIA